MYSREVGRKDMKAEAKIKTWNKKHETNMEQDCEGFIHRSDVCVRFIPHHFDLLHCNQCIQAWRRESEYNSWMEECCSFLLAPLLGKGQIPCSLIKTKIQGTRDLLLSMRYLHFITVVQEQWRRCDRRNQVWAPVELLIPGEAMSLVLFPEQLFQAFSASSFPFDVFIYCRSPSSWRKRLSLLRRPFLLKVIIHAA